MLYFEFDESTFGYYAMIKADSPEVALEVYKEQVNDLDAPEQFGKEISPEMAKERYIYMSSGDRHAAELAFEQEPNNHFILIYGSLL